MGIGDWGLGIGDWGLGPIPNPQSQSPIPNPQSPKKFYLISFLIKFNFYNITMFPKLKKICQSEIIIQ